MEDAAHSDPAQPRAEAPTVDMALANTVRLLRAAETLTDLQMMDRYLGLADTWLSMAGLLHEREKA